MKTNELHSAIDRLPSQLQQLVAQFVATLQHQPDKPVPSNVAASSKSVRAKRLAGLGELRGRIQIGDDFNDPLPEFAEY